MHNFFKSHTLITGTILLTFAGMLTRIMGFFYKIFLSRTIGAEGLGIYQLVFPIMGLCISLTSSGIQTSISRHVAIEEGKHNPAGSKLYLYAGLILSCTLSVIVNRLLYQKADFIADCILKEPRCAPLLQVVSYAFLPCAIHACINGYCYGRKKAAVPALSQLLEQIIRIGSVYLFCLILNSKGMQLNAAMAVWGITLGEIGGMLLSLSVVHFGKASGSLNRAMKNLCSLAIPLTASRLIINLFATFENTMIPIKLKDFGYTSTEALSVYGILTGMALAIIMAPNALTGSISVMLLPSISSAEATDDKPFICSAIKKTIFLSLLFGFLCTFVFLVTAPFIGNIIFQNTLASTFIKILCWICPFIYLNTTLSGILHGLGKAGATFLMQLLGCGIRILFILYAIPILGIRGYLYGLLVSSITITICSVLFLKKNI